MTLHSQRLVATGPAPNPPELVLLHGWGLSSAVWAGWLPLLRRHCTITLVDLPGYGASTVASDSDVDTVIARVLAVAPERAVYIGYSLGGMLATRIAARYPERVQALVTFASNARYVADERWPWAMGKDTFDAFAQSVARPAPALKRFAALQALGGSREKALVRQLRDAQEPLSSQTLADSLRWLAAIDLRDDLAALRVPARFCFARHDALVPVAAAEHFPRDSVVVFDDAPHALFLECPRACADGVLTLLREQGLLATPPAEPGTRNKRDVARSFSRAAATYDSVAALQRRVGEHLLEFVPAVDADQRGPVVDLGCGTGYFSAALARRRPGSEVIGVDLAEGMVRYARAERGAGQWLVGDAESLPLAEQSVAVLFSSLTVQWCENLDALFAEAWRVLKPGGSLVFSTLGPDTLHELRSAWRAVDSHTHVNRFAAWDKPAAALARAGFTEVTAPVEETIVLSYPDLRELTRELKGLGAHNVNPGRPAGLTGKQRLQQLAAAYDRYRDGRGGLPATYQVWYVAVTKPVATATSNNDSGVSA